MVERMLLLLFSMLIAAATSMRIQFVPPEAILQAGYPSGFRAFIPDFPGCQRFAFKGRLNSPLDDNEINTFSADVLRPIGGFWRFEDPLMVLTPGDILHYFTLVVKDNMPFPRHNLSWTVPEPDETVDLLKPVTLKPITAKPPKGKPAKMTQAEPMSTATKQDPTTAKDTPTTAQGETTTAKAETAQDTTASADNVATTAKEETTSAKDTTIAPKEETTPAKDTTTAPKEETTPEKGEPTTLKGDSTPLPPEETAPTTSNNGDDTSPTFAEEDKTSPATTNLLDGKIHPSLLEDDDATPADDTGDPTTLNDDLSRIGPAEPEPESSSAGPPSLSTPLTTSAPAKPQKATTPIQTLEKPKSNKPKKSTQPEISNPLMEDIEELTTPSLPALPDKPLAGEFPEEPPPLFPFPGLFPRPLPKPMLPPAGPGFEICSNPWNFEEQVGETRTQRLERQLARVQCELALHQRNQAQLANRVERELTDLKKLVFGMVSRMSRFESILRSAAFG